MMDQARSSISLEEDGAGGMIIPQGPAISNLQPFFFDQASCEGVVRGLEYIPLL